MHFRFKLLILLFGEDCLYTSLILYTFHIENIPLMYDFIFPFSDSASWDSITFLFFKKIH